MIRQETRDKFTRIYNCYMDNESWYKPDYLENNIIYAITQAYDERKITKKEYNELTAFAFDIMTKNLVKQLGPESIPNKGRRKVKWQMVGRDTTFKYTFERLGKVYNDLKQMEYYARTNKLTDEEYDSLNKRFSLTFGIWKFMLILTRIEKYELKDLLKEEEKEKTIC